MNQLLSLALSRQHQLLKNKNNQSRLIFTVLYFRSISPINSKNTANDKDKCYLTVMMCLLYSK